MPISPKRQCHKPGCPRLAAGAYCDEHRQERAKATAWRDIEGSASSRGYGANWRRLRGMVLARDPVCVACCRAPSVTVDHIVPKHRGGEDEEANLQGLCLACHAAKTAAEGNAAKISRRRTPRP